MGIILPPDRGSSKQSKVLTAALEWDCPNQDIGGHILKKYWTGMRGISSTDKDGMVTISCGAHITIDGITTLCDGTLLVPANVLGKL